MLEQYYIPYFTRAELACRESRQIVLAEGFADKLVELRTKFNKPMVVTSCCRSLRYNQQIGGAKNSFHIYDHPRYGFMGACAIDIAAKDHTNKGNLMTLAWQLGWSIGFHKNFLHLDRHVDYTELKQIVFGY